jgi:hypothetical protein
MSPTIIKRVVTSILIVFVQSTYTHIYSEKGAA